MIYKYNVGYLKGLYYSFLRTASYSDVTHCNYITPGVKRWSTRGGFDFGNMRGGVEMWILKETDSNGRRLSKHFWNIERLHFGLRDSTQDEIRQMYDWLCDRIRAKGGSV